MTCNQGRDCPARKIPPYPHTPTDALPECQCHKGDDPSDIEAIASVALALTIVMVLSVAGITLWRVFH